MNSKESARNAAARWLLALGALGLSGCAATPPIYMPVAGPGDQQLRTNAQTGKAYVLSALDMSRVAIEQADFQHEGLTFNVKVVTDEQGVKFGPANITASQGDNQLVVLGKDQVSKSVAEAHGSRKGAAAIGGAFAFLGAVASTLAGQPQVASNFMTHVSSSATTYQQAAADEQALGGAVAKTHLEKIGLSAGQVMSGLVTVEDVALDEPIEFRVSVGRDVHAIRFLSNGPRN